MSLKLYIDLKKLPIQNSAIWSEFIVMLTWHAVGGCVSNFGWNNTSLHGLHLHIVIQTVKAPAGLSRCQGISTCKRAFK